MDNEVKLLPCPMCGGKAKPAARGQIRPMAMRPEDYIVHCEQCWGVEIDHNRKPETRDSRDVSAIS